MLLKYPFLERVTKFSTALGAASGKRRIVMSPWVVWIVADVPVAASLVSEVVLVFMLRGFSFWMSRSDFVTLYYIR